MMTGTKKTITCLLLFCLLGPFASALEVTEGRVKLVLHEGTGRFSLYYLTSRQENRYVPLIADEDYRTSVLSIVVGNRIYRLGEAGSFKEEVENTEEGPRFIWTSKNLIVTAAFGFVASKGTPLADGIKMTLSLSNVSDRNLEVGVRLLLDTYLGEDSDAHFTTDSGDLVKGEATYAQANVPSYWISAKSDSAAAAGLQVMTRGAQVSPPDSVVFANWKRLNDASWTYETSASRNFNLLPYSINDSAACHYYDPVVVPSGSARTLTVLMGNISPEGFVAAVKGDIGAILEKATAGDQDIDPALALAADIETVSELIKKINEILESEDVSDDDLELIDAVIQELKKKYQVE